jgi:hypothetical protein
MTRTNTNLEDYVRPPRRRLSAAGCLTCLVLLAVVLGVVLAAAVRTKGGSEWIAETIRKKTRLDLEIGEARAGLPFDLVLKNVKARSTEAYGGFKAAEIRLGPRLNGGLELGVTGAELDLVRTADGWLPDAFGRIAELNDVRDTPGLFADVPRGLRLTLHDGALSWSTPDGEVTALLKGIEFLAVPIEIPGRRMWFYDLSARLVKRAGGQEGRNVRRCWMSASDNAYIEIVYRAMWGGAPGSKDWWSSPSVGSQGGEAKDEK